MLKEHFCQRVRGDVCGQFAVVGEYICDGGTVLFDYEQQTK